MTDGSWYRVEKPPKTDLDLPGITDLDLPGIFAWLVDGVVVYVGRAAPLRGRWTAYERNVKALEEGQPYHGDPTQSFRDIHKVLSEARGRSQIVFRVLEVCPGAVDLNDRKRHWVNKLRPTLPTGEKP